MYEYELQAFYSKYGCDRPDKLSPGDEFWTLLWSGKAVILKAVSPIKWGEEFVRIKKYPDILYGKNLYEGDWIHQDLELEPVFLRVVDISNGTVNTELIPEEDWPDFTKTEDDSLFTKLPAEKRKIPKWKGTPQKSGSSGSKNRTRLIRKGDVRGSKNNLINKGGG